MVFFLAIIQGQIKLGLDILFEIFGFKENVIVGELGNLLISPVLNFVQFRQYHIYFMLHHTYFRNKDRQGIQFRFRKYTGTVFKIIKEDEHAVIFWKKWSTDPVSGAFHHSNCIKGRGKLTDTFKTFDVTV